MSLAVLRHEVMWANIGQSQICETKEQKLISIIIDENMNVDEYIQALYKKVRRKPCVLGRICKLLSLQQRSSLKEAFGYCTLVWMLCSRSSNYCINPLH